MRLWLKVLLLASALFTVVVAGAGWYAYSRLNPVARKWVQGALAEKFKSDVELEAVEVTLRPEPVIVARGLALRHLGRTDVPPILVIRKLVLRSSYAALWADVKRIHLAEFEGLKINLPPKGSRPTLPRTAEATNVPKFVIDRVVANGTTLRILPRDRAKEPLEWDISKLRLDSFAQGAPMRFQATLTNAKPPGQIISSGTFGPWNGEDPGQSAVEGEYTFSNADLSVFKGIAGILSSEGSYKGILERIEAHGTTETPDFRLGANGHKVPLRTSFRSIIDGTNGDTTLDPVTARLGNSILICKGSVTGTPGVKGKTIQMAVAITQGRIDDLLRLTVRSAQPLMSGSIRMNARLVIPPGERDVVEKLRLAGTLRMDRVHFTAPELQDKINRMSQTAQGKPKEVLEGDVGSHFDGKFRMMGADIVLDEMTFQIPGASVLLAGSYGVRDETIDMSGKIRMQARVSQTQTGWKSLVLKAVDPFFAKEGVGAVLPIRISGTREKPEFGLQLRGSKKEQERARKL